MGDIARCSLTNEDQLYKLFGINAELLIDHAWGWEPCTIEAIKAYKPESSSISSGQVLQSPYPFDMAKLVVREMTEQLVLELVDKHMVTDQMALSVGYDRENLLDPSRRAKYQGPVETDRYGRQIPKSAHGSINLKRQTSSTRMITAAVMELYDRLVHPDLLIRRMYVVANRIVNEEDVREEAPEQLDMFTDYEAERRQKEAEAAALEKERRGQLAVLEIKKKFGKNAILKGMNLQEGATGKERNETIGGHKA